MLDHIYSPRIPRHRTCRGYAQAAALLRGGPCSFSSSVSFITPAAALRCLRGKLQASSVSRAQATALLAAALCSALLPALVYLAEARDLLWPVCFDVAALACLWLSSARCPEAAPPLIYGPRGCGAARARLVSTMPRGSARPAAPPCPPTCSRSVSAGPSPGCSGAAAASGRRMRLAVSGHRRRGARRRRPKRTKKEAKRLRRNMGETSTDDEGQATPSNTTCRRPCRRDGHAGDAGRRLPALTQLCKGRPPPSPAGQAGCVGVPA